MDCHLKCHHISVGCSSETFFIDTWVYEVDELAKAPPNRYMIGDPQAGFAGPIIQNGLKNSFIFIIKGS